jgi:hypothetical protein
MHAELEPKGLTVITVAFDTAGEAAARPWIEAAKPQHPSLIDRQHLVADLYGMVNVPMAAWIDEEGRLVRPPEPAGASDDFRTMDRTTFAMPPEAIERLRHRRRTYAAALRDWAEKGAESEFALSPEEVRKRLRGRPPEHALANAHFVMAEYLVEQGDREAAQRHLAEAKRLHPENWSFRRQSWALEDPAKAGGPEYWAAVDALGDRPYYDPIDMPGIEPGASVQPARLDDRAEG